MSDRSARPAPEPPAHEPAREERPHRENPYLRRRRTAADKPASPRRPVSEASARRRARLSHFFSNHARLLAALATVLVILSLVFIVDLQEMAVYITDRGMQSIKDDLTMEYVRGLSQKSEPITWSDLQRFYYKESTAEDSVTWRISVSHTGYEVWISGVSTDKPPTYVYLYNMDTGERWDLNRESLP